MAGPRAREKVYCGALGRLIFAVQEVGKADRKLVDFVSRQLFTPAHIYLPKVHVKLSDDHFNSFLFLK